MEIVTKSKGIKRGLAAFFAALSLASNFVPVLLPYKPIFETLAGVLGGTGLVHAGLQKVGKKREAQRRSYPGSGL